MDEDQSQSRPITPLHMFLTMWRCLGVFVFVLFPTLPAQAAIADTSAGYVTICSAQGTYRVPLLPEEEGPSEQQNKGCHSWCHVDRKKPVKR
jgi:hypothetical protein